MISKTSFIPLIRENDENFDISLACVFMDKTGHLL